MARPIQFKPLHFVRKLVLLNNQIAPFLLEAEVGDHLAIFNLDAKPHTLTCLKQHNIPIPVEAKSFNVMIAAMSGTQVKCRHRGVWIFRDADFAHVGPNNQLAGTKAGSAPLMCVVLVHSRISLYPRFRSFHKTKTIQIESDLFMPWIVFLKVSEPILIRNLDSVDHVLQSQSLLNLSIDYPFFQQTLLASSNNNGKIDTLRLEFSATGAWLLYDPQKAAFSSIFGDSPQLVSSSSLPTPPPPMLALILISN